MSMLVDFNLFDNRITGIFYTTCNHQICYISPIPSSIGQLAKVKFINLFNNLLTGKNCTISSTKLLF